MKIDFNQPLKTLEGTDWTADKGTQKLTLRKVCVASLLGTYADEPSLPGEEKFARYKLAEKLYDAEVDLTLEEIVKIKKLVGKFFEAGVVGPAFQALEGKAASS